MTSTRATWLFDLILSGLGKVVVNSEVVFCEFEFDGKYIYL